MKSTISSVCSLFLLASLVAVSAWSDGPMKSINHCAPSLSQEIVALYESKNGAVTTDQIRHGSALLGNISNAFEYIVIHELSYQAACADQVSPAEPVNLGRVEDVDSSLKCTKPEMLEVSALFKNWLSNEDCKLSLAWSYPTGFRDCMGDYYSQWQSYFEQNHPATWDARGVSDLFIRWALMNNPGVASCSGALTQIFLND